MKPRAMKNGKAKKMMRGGKADKPMAMKNGGNAGTKIKNALKKAGSLTAIPYALKSAGYDDLAYATGYPFDEGGKRRPEMDFEGSEENLRKRGDKLKRKKEPFQKAKETMGYKGGGKAGAKKMMRGGKAKKK